MKRVKVTKADLVEEIYLDSDLTKNDIRTILDKLGSTIKKSLVDDKIIELRGFGTFELKTRKGRDKARNPRTGELVSVEAHAVVSFRSGKELKTDVWKVRG